MEATRLIYEEFRRWRNGMPEWKDVEMDFNWIIDVDEYEDRLTAVREYVRDPNLEYKKDNWVDEAIEMDGDDLRACKNFTQTDWYRFQQAAKMHLATVVNMLNTL